MQDGKRTAKWSIDKELSADKSKDRPKFYFMFLIQPTITTITHLNLKSTPCYFTGF